MANTRMTQEHMNRRLLQDRKAEARHKELLAFSRTNQRQAAENRQNTLVEMNRKKDRQVLEEVENLMGTQSVAKAKADREARRSQQQDEMLAKQLMKRKSEQERAEREIQRICEGSEVLKELEKNLQTAYMNQERVLQLEEAALKAEQDQSNEQAVANQMEVDRQNAILEMQYQESMRKQHAIDGRQKLEEQMEVAHFSRMKEAADEAEKDKAMVDKIIRRIEEEDYTDYMERMGKIQKTKRVIEDYKKQRAQEIANAERVKQEEEDKILSYAKAKGAREAIFKAAQDQKKAEEEARFKAIEEKMRLEREQEEEFQMLRDMLWEEERENRLRVQERQKKAAQDQAKIDMMQANEQQKILKKQLKAEQEAEEEQLRQLMADKFAEDIRLDEEARQRRMRERKEYQRQIVQQNEDKKRIYKLEKDAEIEARRRVAEEEAFKERVVEAARQRLLQMHSRVVSGFAPKGTLAKPSDLEMLSQAY